VTKNHFRELQGAKTTQMDCLESLGCLLGRITVSTVIP
jgi:hypothetical protein